MVSFSPTSIWLKEHRILVGIVATLPFLGAVILWLLRQRATRNHWAASLLVASVSLAAMAYLGLRLPLIFSLSNWQPADLFQAELVLSADRTSWAIALAVAAMPLSLFLNSPVRPDSSNPTTRVLILAYAGLATLGVLAANSVTTIMTWASTDILGFVIVLATADEYSTVKGGFQRLLTHFASILLVLAGSLQIFVDSADGQIQQALWLLAVFFRIGLWPLHVPMPSLPGIRRGLGVALRLLPPVMGIAFLARVSRAEFAGIFSSWLLAIAIVSILVGGIRWSISNDPVSDRPFFVLTLAGMALALSAGGAGLTDPIIGVAILVVSLGTLISQFVIYEAWHRFLLIVLVALSIGAPFTAGHLLYQLDAEAGTFTFGSIATMASLVTGVAMLTIGIARSLEAPVQGWASGENFVKNSYIAALTIPALVPLITGIQMGAIPELNSVILMAIAAALSIGLWLAWTRWRNFINHAYQIASPGLTDRYGLAVGQLSQALLKSGAGLLRGVGLFIEGRAALLWVYVTLLFAALLIFGGGS